MAEIDEEGVGGRVDRLQAARNRRRVAFAAFHEFLAGDDLEQIAAAEAFLGLHDKFGIFAGTMIALGRDRIGCLEGIGCYVRGLAVRRHAALFEIVTVDPGLGGIVINDQDFIGQEQHHVALVFRACQRQLDGVELESEVVTEGAEQADCRIRVRIEEVDYGAQRSEDGRDF